MIFYIKEKNKKRILILVLMIPHGDHLNRYNKITRKI